jgi:hypothetical protein
MAGEGDYLRQVRAGEKFSPNARTENALREAAKWVQKQLQAQTPPRGLGLGCPNLGENVVWVKNNSGSNVPQFGVLGISGTLFSPSTNPSAFNEQVTITGVTPTSSQQGLFVVTIEPIAAGAAGRAVVTGTTIAKVNFTNSADPYADVLASDNTQLQSGSSGAAQILANPSGATGSQLAIVRIGEPGGAAGALVDVALSSPSGSVSAGYSYTVKDINGNTLGTGLTPTFRPFSPATINLTGAATSGAAYKNSSGTWVLKYADEQWSTTSC